MHIFQTVLEAWDTVIESVQHLDEPALFEALKAKPLELKVQFFLFVLAVL
jgi:hypothetical protein